MKRLVVVESVYHCAGGPPTSHEARFNRQLRTDEQPYQRVQVNVGREWQPLDAGWLADKGCSLVVLENVKASRRQFILADQPTATQLQPQPPEQPSQDKTGWLEIGIAVDEQPPSTGFAWLPPGETLRMLPTLLAALRVRCIGGVSQTEARLSYLILPE